ncbi:hypothetical protein GQR58_024625 [Nymphon striatum]|nr:hypothetical protein GQR58_024625 [Nymphon striatum]
MKSKYNLLLSFKKAEISEHLDTVDLEMIKSDELDSTLNPQIIPGEVVIAFAENVLKFDAFSNEKRGLSGSLFCTNFKLSFVTAESFSQSNAIECDKTRMFTAGETCEWPVCAGASGSNSYQNMIRDGNECIVALCSIDGGGRQFFCDMECGIL